MTESAVAIAAMSRAVIRLPSVCSPAGEGFSAWIAPFDMKIPE
jgi:hypothetical protein